MRLIRGIFTVVLLFGWAVFGSPLWAQNPDTMAPDASEARAKQVIGQAIQALGGPGYLAMTERECEGRRALFGHTGELAGYVQFKDSWSFPDKDRIDYFAKNRNTLLGYMIGVQDLDLAHGGLVITLFSGEHGWTMDRSGVSEMPDVSISEFQEALKRSTDNLLRLKLKEPGLLFRWAGRDTVDLREVDWVEITDQEQRTFRLAVDRSTHFLVRTVVRTQDENTGESREDVTIFTNYQLKNGVQFPMQISREKDGRRVTQVFYDSCRSQPDLGAKYFTKEALEQKFKETHGKKGK